MRYPAPRYLLILFILCLSVFSFGQQAGSKQGDSRLARLKTAYIYNFTKNIYWPKEDQLKEFRICVMSSISLAEQLQELESAAKFRSRVPIKVVFCRNADEITPCQMVVVDGSGKENLWSVYSKIRGKAVLMVAENLADYKKSMISFMVVDGKMKYIINKTKMDESVLNINEKLYALAITKEGDWKSIFDKFQYMLSSGDKEVKLDKADIAQMISEYKTLEDEKKVKDVTITQMEDTLKSKMELLRSKMEEYHKVSARIEDQKKILSEQTRKMAAQKSEILLRETEIGKQKTVITIIAALTLGILILLLFAVRANSQRRKANTLLSVQKTEVEKQKQLVEEKQKEIVDSINYAKRIQTALMASDSTLKQALPEHFVLFRPKDIVAGDFYWAATLPDSFMYITADSTGHGVPGAFMSLLNISKLNEAVNQKSITRPDLVLNHVKTEIIQALNPKGSTEESKDGMDAVLCKLNLKQRKLQYAAANSSFCIVRNGTILTCPADKMPVGKSHDDHSLFTFSEIGLEEGDMIYTFTDGYADQFGGPSGKKLKLKALKALLLQLAGEPIQVQKEKLAKHFDDWKGKLEQVDDVLLMGVRV